MPARISSSHAFLQAFDKLNDDGVLDKLFIHKFEHSGGARIRGFGANQPFHEGEVVFAVPRNLRLTTEDVTAPRFQGHPTIETKFALWLAEKRAQAAASSLLWNQASVTKDFYWKLYVRSLPDFKKYRTLGFPLAAPLGEVQKLSGLPIVDNVATWVNGIRDGMQQALNVYNESRGDRPALSMDEALWGLISVFSRSFSCGGTTIAPVGDMLNSLDAPHRNVDYFCEGNDSLVFKAARNIRTGEELIDTYSLPDQAWIRFCQHGAIFDNADPERWSSDDCETLNSKQFGQDGSEFLQAVDKLVTQNCRTTMEPSVPAPASLNWHSSLKVASAGIATMDVGVQAQFPVAIAAMAMYRNCKKDFHTCFSARQILSPAAFL